MQLKASAPGSLMLLGEYAVLYGKQAVVCAVDKRISVILTPRADKKIEIHSASLGHYSTDISSLKIEKPFQFVLGALMQYQANLKRGCDLTIETEFSDKVGLGSSAAVTVATLAVLVSWLELRISPLDLVHQGRQVVRQVQGVGSGADIAASVFGGIVGYTAQPLQAEKYSVSYPLTALYSGFKTPTAEAIKRVQTHFSSYPNLLRNICQSIGQCAMEGLLLLKKEDWSRFGEVMNSQQGLMESLGVSSPLLHSMVEGLRSHSGILGAKISGSGLGDCVIGLGVPAKEFQFAGNQQGVRQIPVAMTLQGVYCEKI